MSEVPWTYTNDSKSQKEGQSHMRSPYFDGGDYSYWKQRMRIHLGGIDPNLWKIVRDGFTFTEGTETTPLNATQIKENDRLDGLNCKAMSVLYCGLSRNEFNHISSCLTGQQIWLRLEVIHMGTSEVKKTRIRALSQVYEAFCMNEDESIDSFFARFSEIVNPWIALGKVLTQEEQIDKILTSLRGTYWLIKRSAIEEGKFMDTLTFEELMGKLKAFEVGLQISGEMIPKKIEALSLVPKVEKSIAFEASQSKENLQNDEDFALLTKSFGKYLKNNKARTGNVWGNTKAVGESPSPRCFRCNELGHIKVDCPYTKADKKKGKEAAQPSRSFQRGMLASFGAEDAAELSSSDDEFPNGTCFMVNEDTQVQSSTLESNDNLEVDEFVFDEAQHNDLYEAYEKLIELYGNVRSKMILLEKEKASLEDSNESLQDEVGGERHRAHELEIKRKELQTIIENFDTTTMQTINDELLEAQTKIEGLEKLKMKLASQLTEKMSLIASKDNDVLEANATIASMKLEFDKTLSFKATDLRLSVEKNKILEENCCKLESALSNLKGKEKVVEPTIGVLPSQELDAQMVARMEVLEKENSRLTTLVKSFTNSQLNMDQMLDSLGSHQSRQGIGFGKKKINNFRPNETVYKNVRKEPSYNVDQFYYDMCFSNYVYTKKTCHHCNVVGHLSFDCLARYYPKSFYWRVKAKANMRGTIEKLPKGAPSFVGATSSSK